MVVSTEPTRALASQHTLVRLVTIYSLTALAFAAWIWFELPASASPFWLAAAVLLALVTAVCAGRTAARALAAMPYRKRPSISARGIGMLAAVVLVAIPIAVAKFVYPKSWPTSVDAAVSKLHDELDREQERDLAYMAYDDLAGLQGTLGADIRSRFGLNTRNFRLAYDCDPEYMHPHTCASVIISRLWKRVRAELPPAERQALEALESGMDRVRLGSERFEDVPLAELVAFFNEAVRTQLPQSTQFTIVCDPADADERISTAWHVMGTLSLREALGVFTENGSWRVRKDPPNLVIERS